MGKILGKFMKKYWKNAKKNWKSQGNSSVQKSGNHETISSENSIHFGRDLLLELI